MCIRDRPAPFGVGRHVALDEDGALPRINAAGQQQGGHRARLVAQLRRVLRHGQAVQINDAEEVGLVRLLGRPAPDRPQVVALSLIHI